VSRTHLALLTDQHESCILLAMHTRAGNLLGASPIGVAYRVQRETEAVAGRSGGRVAAPATLAQWLGDTIEEPRHSLGLSHSATVRVIDGLVTDRLAEQRHPGDGPAVRSRLTRAGQVQARRILAARRRVLRWILSDLSGEEPNQLTATVERLLERLTPTSMPESMCSACVISRSARRTAARSSACSDNS
jgi:MarR family transcriptional repressor of emrRAB